jgi:hypothetical protein
MLYPTVSRDRDGAPGGELRVAVTACRDHWLPQAAGLAGTLEELRGYARGVLPAVLADGGLAPALKALAQRAPYTELYRPSLAVLAFPVVVHIGGTT